MLRIIKLSKSEQQTRMVDPDWVYIDPKEWKKLMRMGTKPYKKTKGIVIVTTTPDNNNNEFKKLWQLSIKNISKKK